MPSGSFTSRRARSASADRRSTMSLEEMFGFAGRRALVVGGATGMGAAAATIIGELGADVTVMDYADVSLPGVKGVKLDLRDKAGIEAAVDSCAGPFDAVLSC